MRIKLKVAILATGKTQREVAVACGIAESRLSEIIRGWRDPRPDERTRLALKQAWSHHASWSNKMTPCHHVCARRVGAVVESGRSR